MDTYKVRAYIALSMLGVMLIVLWGNSMGLVSDFVRNQMTVVCFVISLISLIFLQFVDSNHK